jgi:hypothetical protein
MEFGEPVKSADGSYIVKVTGDVKFQVTNMTLGDTTSVTSSDAKTIKDIEESILLKAEEVSESWFGQVVSPGRLRRSFNSSIEDSVFDCIMSKSVTYWNSKKELVTSEDVGTNVDCIVELVGVRISKKIFEPLFRIIQVKEHRQVQKPSYMFKDEPEDEDII